MKKRKRVEEAAESEVVVNGKFSTAGPSIIKTQAGECKERHLYQGSYLALGLTWCVEECGHKPECVIRGTELTNDAVRTAPSDR